MRAVLALCFGLLGVRSGAAQDRWQLTLNSGKTVWDLRLVKLAGDTLVVRHDDSTFALPLTQLDELRLVKKATRHITPEPGRYGGVLGGADDEVYRLTLYTLAERSEEHTSELQSRPHLVCRLLLEKKKISCFVGVWIDGVRC